MKKAFKINLGGQIFHIDEDAYEKLRVYLDTISSHFSNIEESREIMNDIETRIAELFREQIRDDTQVIGLRDVEKVISIMGKPEEIVDEEAPGNGKQKSSSDSSGRRNRRLYRDPDNAVVGGVASGLAAYFDIDVVVVRILFVVFTLVGWGFALLAYIVLWVAVPKAISAAEKLEMRGEKVNVSNLEKKIREEYDDVKENLKKARNSENVRSAENFFVRFFGAIGTIFLAFLKFIVAIVAIALIIAGISMVVSLVGVAFFGTSLIPFEVFHSHSTSFGELVLPFMNPANLGVIALAGSMLILLPLIALIYGLFKALFRFKAKDRSFGLSLFALWIVALITTITLAAFEAKNYSEGEEVTRTNTLVSPETKSLYIKMDKDILKDGSRNKNFEINDRWYLIEKGDKIYGEVEVDIEKSRTGELEILIEKGSRGYDRENASYLAERISYNYYQSDTVLTLEPYFSTDVNDRWRMQTVGLTILVPENYTVTLDKNTASYLQGIYNLDRYSSFKMAGKRWRMKEDGLEHLGVKDEK
jgi:phage shock protein PspC (stress-responsive transcriptional regulator)